MAFQPPLPSHYKPTPEAEREARQMATADAAPTSKPQQAQQVLSPRPTIMHLKPVGENGIPFTKALPITQPPLAEPENSCDFWQDDPLAATFDPRVEEASLERWMALSEVYRPQREALEPGFWEEEEEERGDVAGGLAQRVNEGGRSGGSGMKDVDGDISMDDELSANAVEAAAKAAEAAEDEAAFDALLGCAAELRHDNDDAFAAQELGFMVERDAMLDAECYQSDCFSLWSKKTRDRLRHVEVLLQMLPTLRVGDGERAKEVLFWRGCWERHNEPGAFWRRDAYLKFAEDLAWRAKEARKTEVEVEGVVAMMRMCDVASREAGTEAGV